MEVGDVCRLVSERLHLLPPFRWRLVGVPFGIDLPNCAGAQLQAHFPVSV